jgi:hypothetical protein
MLTISLISILFIIICKSRFIIFIIICFFLVLYYISNLNMFFNSTISVNREFLINDEVSLFITFLLFFIMFIRYLLGNIFKMNKSLSLSLFILIFVCFQVFNTSHLFNLYFFYEASLIPILYIIIK